MIAKGGSSAAAPSPAATAPAPAPAPHKMPLVFVESKSSGTNLNTDKNQSIEMAEDFGKSCPSLQISISETGIDYHIVLNHIESGLLRTNQIEVANAAGVLIS